MGLVVGGKKRAKVIIAHNRRDESKVPVGYNYSELVGKAVEHFCYLDEEDKQGWRRGVVLAKPGKYRFQMCCNNSPDVIYSRQMYQDFNA